jgi:two-component system OmpR family response regulator/two-component system copper resistance phosphate regulon response regulator CusR
MEILLVEDDPVIGKAVHQGLSEANHECTWVRTGTEGLEHAMTQRYDAVILDLLLPGVAGLALLEQVRRAGVTTPVLALTALGSVDDRVKGLRSGADDYLVKPFAMAELLARVEAIQRRSGPRPSPLLKAGDLTLDLSARCVTMGEVEIDLTPTEFSILEMLMRHAGQVVTRKMLCESLWEADWEGTTNVIEVHINRLRGKLQRGSREPLIHTVRGRGYALRAI